MLATQNPQSVKSGSEQQHSRGSGTASAESSTLGHRSDNSLPLESEFQRGFEAGARATESALRKEYEDKTAEERLRIGIFLVSIQEQLEVLQSRAERTVVHLAIAVAEQIIKREVMLDRELVLRQIKEAVRRVMGVGHIKLRVNPSDEQMVRDHRAGLLSGSDSIREIVVEPDEKVAPGGCILESDSGNVDARLATQLQKIEVAFTEEEASA